MASNSSPEDLLALSTFDFAANNPLRIFSLVSSSIERLRSRQSTPSFETPTISASCYWVNCKEIRKLTTLRPIDEPRTKLRAVVIALTLTKKTSKSLNGQSYLRSMLIGVYT